MSNIWHICDEFPWLYKLNSSSFLEQSRHISLPLLCVNLEKRKWYAYLLVSSDCLLCFWVKYNFQYNICFFSPSFPFKTPEELSFQCGACYMTDVFPQDKWDRRADVGHEHKWQLQQRLYFVKIGFAVKITNQAIPQAPGSTSFTTAEFIMAFVYQILHWTSSGHTTWLTVQK